MNPSYEEAFSANDPYIDHLEAQNKELNDYIGSGIPKTGIQIIAEQVDDIKKLEAETAKLQLKLEEKSIKIRELEEQITEPEKLKHLTQKSI